MYNYLTDDNLDPHEAVLSFTTYDKQRLNRCISRLTAAGWQLEHYDGPLTAVLIR